MIKLLALVGLDGLFVIKIELGCLSWNREGAKESRWKRLSLFLRPFVVERLSNDS